MNDDILSDLPLKPFGGNSYTYKNSTLLPQIAVVGPGMDIYKMAKNVRRVAMENGGDVAINRSDYDLLRSAGYGINAASMRFTELDVVLVSGFVGFVEPVSPGNDID